MTFEGKTFIYSLALNFDFFLVGRGGFFGMNGWMLELKWD